MKKFWDNLTSGQKLMVVILVLVLIWISWNTIKGGFRAASNSIQNGGEMAVLSSSGIKPSYSAKTYTSMADTLYKAMDGGGSDEEDIYAVFRKLKNDADFIKLDQAFGIRDATDNLFGLIPAEDLEGWIQGDLESYEIAEVNNILRERGITKTFEYLS